MSFLLQFLHAVKVTNLVWKWGHWNTYVVAAQKLREMTELEAKQHSKGKESMKSTLLQNNKSQNIVSIQKRYHLK